MERVVVEGEGTLSFIKYCLDIQFSNWFELCIILRFIVRKSLNQSGRPVQDKMYMIAYNINDKYLSKFVILKH